MKCGKLLQGIEIISFEKLVQVNHNNLVIVICSDYENEIKQQLLDRDIYNFISISQIDFGGGEGYYDEQYFN